MSKTDKIIIVGNGMAGITAAAEIRKKDEKIPVEIISREKIHGYHRPMLTKTIADGVNEDIFFIKPKSWYEKNNIKVTLDTNVISINPSKHFLVLSDGSKKEYDTLILATGAEAFVPPIPGHDLAGVFTIRHWTDTQSIHDMLDEVTHAVVIGGGVLGLEAAWDIKKAVKDVTVIDRSGGLMSRQLDEAGSTALKQAADQIGIKIEFKAETEKIEGQGGKVTGVSLKSGKTLKAQLVIISTGIKQNTDLLKDVEGAKIGKSIIVNDKMVTGIPGIYAIGDCAEAGGVNYGILPQASETAKAAVADIFGENHKYKPIVPANMVVLSNIKLYAIGDNGKKKDVDYELVEWIDDDTGNIQRYYFSDNKLVGGTLIGDISKMSKLKEAFDNSYDKDKFIEVIS